MYGKASFGMKLRRRIRRGPRELGREHVHRALEHLAWPRAGRRRGRRRSAWCWSPPHVMWPRSSGSRRRRSPSARSGWAGTRRARVGAGVLEHVELQAVDHAVAGRPELEVRAPARGRGCIATMFSLRVSVQRTGRPGRARQPARGSRPRPGALGSEPAAHVGRHHPHVLVVQPEQLRRGTPCPGGVSGTRSTSSAARPRRTGRPRSAARSGRAEIRWLTSGPHATSQTRAGRIGVRCGHRRADVRAHLREQQDLVLDRLERVGHRRQRVVVDRDELGGVHARLARVGEHHRDDVAHEPTVSLARNGRCMLGSMPDERRGRARCRSVSAAVNTWAPGGSRRPTRRSR